MGREVAGDRGDSGVVFIGFLVPIINSSKNAVLLCKSVPNSSIPMADAG
jgi:hypothetical protein